jgi:uncharacterized membrane protein
MSAAHIHLLLNHIPILGTLFGLIVLLYAFVRDSDEVMKVSLGTFVVTALITIPVYLTGDGAADIVAKLPGVSLDIIQRHDSAATVTIIAIELLGAVSLWGLWQSRRSTELARWITVSVLVLGFLSTGLAMWTGTLGGQVRHTEVRVDFPK